MKALGRTGTHTPVMVTRPNEARVTTARGLRADRPGVREEAKAPRSTTPRPQHLWSRLTRREAPPNIDACTEM